MAVSVNGDVAHPHNRRQVLPPGDSQRISQQLGIGSTTKTGYIGEGSQLLM